MMGIRNPVRLEHVIEALNIQPPTEEEETRFKDIYAAARGSLPRKETRPFTAARLARVLRNYVDAWLKTGRWLNGREYPGQRELNGRPFIVASIYLQHYRPEVRISPQGGLIVDIEEVAPHPVGPGKLFEAVDAEAARLFTGLMLNDRLECLCKCAKPECGRYFLLRNPRRVYKHGTFCSRSHQMFATAQFLTRKRRLAVKQQLIEFAAEQLLDWKVKNANWVNHPRQKQRLASRLSERMKRNPNLQTTDKNEVKANWVTWHQKQIEDRRIQLQRQKAVQ